MNLRKRFTQCSMRVATGLPRAFSRFGFSGFTRSTFVAALVIPLLLDAGGWVAPPSNALSAATGMRTAVQATEVPCSVAPSSGPQGATLPVTITLGPHSAVTTLIARFARPEDLQAVTTITFSPSGISPTNAGVQYIGVQQIRYTVTLTIASEAEPGLRDMIVRVQPPGAAPIELSCADALTVQTPEEFIEGLNETFRDEVAGALQQISRQIRRPIRTDNFAALLPQDGTSVIVNAGLTGVENLTLEQLAGGADVLLVFLRLRQDSALPSGFYLIRVSASGGDPDSSWRAQFKNLQGQVVLESEAKVGGGDPAIRQFMCTVGERGELILIDEHDVNKSIRISLPMGTGRPDQRSLPPAGQAIVQAANNFYQAALGYNSSRSNVQRQAIGSRDDMLTVFTVFRGVERLTLEQLARGQDVFFGYFREPLIPAGFYTFRVFQDETGRWWRASNSSRRQIKIEMSARQITNTASQGNLNLRLDVSQDRVRVGLIIPQGPQSIAVTDCGNICCECDNPV